MKILMVCLGNICRSPLAEGILKSKLPESFIVESAGTIDMHEGKNPDHRSIETGHKYKVDISQQQSRHFSENDFKEFGHIFCMDQNNVQDVLSLAKTESDRNKVSLILENNQEVPDPYWSEMDAFDKVYHMLDKACDRITDDLLSRAKSKKSQV